MKKHQPKPVSYTHLETEFKLYELDVTEIISKEELIEKINKLEFEKNNLIEIVLVGKRNFEIDRYELYKLISNDKIIKIKNKTKINYDLEKIANETTLKGLFAKEMLQKLNNENISNEEKEMIEKAVETVSYTHLDVYKRQDQTILKN